MAGGKFRDFRNRLEVANEVVPSTVAVARESADVALKTLEGCDGGGIRTRRAKLVSAYYSLQEALRLVDTAIEQIEETLS